MVLNVMCYFFETRCIIRTDGQTDGQTNVICISRVAFMDDSFTMNKRDRVTKI